MAAVPRSKSGACSGPPPLVVDLDHSLVRTDCLAESLVKLLFSAPGKLFAVAAALLKGKAAFKARLAQEVQLDAALLPYDEVVLARIGAHRAAGGKVYLVTASHQQIADAVAAHLGLFDGAIGSDGATNLKGPNKAARLRERFGAYQYLGDSQADLAVWKEADAAVVVGRRAAVVKAARVLQPQAEVLLRPGATARDWLKALRVHQWSKNAVLFIALFLSQELSDLPQVGLVVAAFVLFGVVASATYLINDLADLDADRAHPTKRMRALASGRISVAAAGLAAILLLAGGFATAAWLSTPLLASLTCYLAVTLAYSFVIKRQPLLDLLCIGVLFGIRVGAGIVIIDKPLSVWLCAFTVMLFTSLAAAKRHAELIRATQAGKLITGRGYLTDDAPLTLSLGVGAGSTCTLLMLLYMQFEAVVIGLYKTPDWLFLIPLVLASWLMRIWVRAHRGELHDDPVIFALRDRISWLHAVLVASLWVAAAVGV